jgi:tRNA 2-thiouridine synthesizing protein E
MEKTIECHGKKLELDEDGYLKDIDNWDVRVAEELAKTDNVGELTSEHWKLITAIRFHYERTHESPLCRDIHVESGFTKQDMHRLFPPLGYKTAYKVSGLPKPIEC